MPTSVETALATAEATTLRFSWRFDAGAGRLGTSARPLAPAWLDDRNLLATAVLAVVGIVLWSGGVGTAPRDLLDHGAALAALATRDPREER